MQRRFHIMVEFKPLKTEGLKKLLKNYFPEKEFTEEQIAKLCKYQSATPGDFGTLFERIRFMDEKSVTASYITEELSKLQEEKDGSKRRIGF